MADELKGCVMMSTPKSKYSAARHSLPDDLGPWSPDFVENAHPFSSPVLYQKPSVYSTTSDIRRTLLEGKMESRLAFGSPSYPSPLDRVRSHKKDRALQMGLSAFAEESFELNQSYPKVSRPKLNEPELPAPKTKIGDGLNDFSFSPGLCKGSFTTANDSGQSLNESWSFYNYIGCGQTGVTFPTTVRNPNKAICTINAKTSEILIANDMACELFGYDQSDLVGRALNDLIQLKPRDQKSLAESHLEPTGEVVSLSGIVVDAVVSSDLIVPVSLWVKKLDYQAQARCLCVMEPVDRSVGTVLFDRKGSVLSCDHKMAILHGYPSSQEIQGLTMKHLIPTFKQPISRTFGKDIKKQQATGKTKSGALFPLSIIVSLAEESNDMRNIPPDTELIIKAVAPDVVFVGVVWVFANISGMITFLPNGTIHNVNDNFSRMLFGFNKDELVGQDISILIPDFYELLDLEDDDIPLPPLGDDDVTTNGTAHVNDNSDVLKELRDLNIDSPDVTSTPRSRLHLPNRIEEKKAQRVEKDSVASITDGKTSMNGIARENTSLKLSKQAYKENFFEKLSRELDDIKEDSNKDSSHDSALSHSDGSNELSTSPVEMSTLPIELSASIELSTSPDTLDDSSDKNGAETSNSDGVNCSQDGTNADISSDSSGDARMIQADTVMVKNRKLKIGVDAHKRAMPKNQDTPVETSSDSGEGSFACVGDKATDSLPVFSSSDHDFDTSSKEMLNGDESSYFSSFESSASGKRSRHRRAVNQLSYSPDSAYGRKGHSRGGNRHSKSAKPHPWNDNSNSARDNSSSPRDSSRSPRDNSRSPSNSSHSPRDNSRSPRDNSRSPSNSSHSPRDSSCLPRDNSRSPSNSSHSPRDNSRSPWDNSHSPRDNSCSLSNSSHSPSDNSCSPNDSSHSLRDNSRSPSDNSRSPSDHSRSPNDSTNGLSDLGSPESGGSKPTWTRPPRMLPTGSFTGFCRHKDGHRLPIMFQIKSVELEDGSVMYCMWISRDPEEPGEGGRSFANLTLASSFNSTLDKSSISLGELLTEKANSDSKLADPEESKPTTPTVNVTDEPGKGEYNENYATLDSIGKGAFGFVKLGKRKSDGEQVVVKFIRRAKVLSLYWVDHEIYGQIPLEVGLLLTLSHPNIVRVLDVYQNIDFIQMVMEKHGSGMDLFEFIDRGPLLDEALCSYMFKQIVAAVVYLHAKNIVHRDIKDENIIVSETFNIKLIDFGAATYLKQGKLFGTFCGTIEYCSPEVLLGNKYKGPELEVWSMGVTLYTLVFGENPFFDIEETIQGVLNPPFKVSQSLMFLISWLLHPDPVCRVTVQDVERNAWVNQPVHISLYKWSQVLPNCEFHGNTASDNRKDTPNSPVDTPGSEVDTSPETDLNSMLRKRLSLNTSTDYY